MVNIEAIEKAVMTADEKTLEQMAETMSFDIYSRLSPEARRRLGRALKAPVPIDYEKNIKIIERILDKAKINNNLRVVLQDIKQSLTEHDLARATALTAIKSSIASLETTYGEDTEYNKKALGKDVYQILDHMHHELALESGELPSGMAVLKK